MAVTAPAACTAAGVLDVAKSQLGVSESPAYSNKTPYTRWYGLTGPWCAMFVSWCLHTAGFPIAITTKKGYAYCPDGVNYFKRNGAWADKSVQPKPGWVVFFDFPGDGVNRPSHTGLVEGRLADGRISCIEGNTNGAGSRTGGNVMRHYRSISGGIIGYGIIDYQSDAPAAQEAEMFIVETTGKYAGHLFLMSQGVIQRIPQPKDFYDIVKQPGVYVHKVLDTTFDVYLRACGQDKPIGMP